MSIYTVQEGDSVFVIAQKFNLSPEWIIAANDLKESDVLIVGQNLVITPYAKTYTVKKGDTLYEIAHRFSTDVRSIFQKNPQLQGKEDIYPGETLVIAYENIPKDTLTVNGYAYPFIDLDVLRKTLPYLTHLTVFTYGFEENAELIEADDESVLALAKEYGVTPILLLSTLTKDGVFDNRLSSRLLQDPDLQERLIENLIKVMQEKGYVAIDVDFEYVFPSDKDSYALFMRRLEQRMQANNLGTVVSLAPKKSAAQVGLLYEAHDYAQLGAAADRATIMAYEWGYTYGPPWVFCPL